MQYKIFLFTILASVGFFNPHNLLSPQAQKLIFFLGVIGSYAVAIERGVSLREVRYPRLAYFSVLGGIFISIFMASAFHMQGLKVSVVTTLPYLLAYSYFYALMKLDIPRDKIIKTYYILFMISSVVYFINVMTVPNNMFGEPILNDDTETRGIIRIPVVFIEFIPLLTFYAINQYLLNHKKKWLVMIAWTGLMIVMSVIRQIIGLTAVLGLFFYFRKVSLKVKIAMAAAVVAIVAFVLPMIPMYNAMLELSEKQKEENEDVEDVRIQAWRYYTYENQTNALTPIFGNGIPAIDVSRWGIIFDSETKENGCFDADVSWAGFYWHFGLIATVALIVLLAKALRKPKPQSRQYLNYWLIFLIFTAAASGPLLYYWQIIDIMVCLYLVYKKNDTDDDEDTDRKSVPDSPDNTELQQPAGYPQLR